MCRGSTVTITQIHLNQATTEWRSYPLASISLPSGMEPINLTWMNSSTIAIMSSDERLYLYDATKPSRQLLDVVDCAAVRLVYSTATYKGLSNGGRVSAALQCMAERTAYQSVVGRSDIYLLGTNTLYRVRVRSWEQRLDGLVDEGEHNAALQLAIQFATGKMRVTHRRNDVAAKIVKVAVDYLERVMTKDLPKCLQPTVLTEHYRAALPAIVEALVTVDKTDVLFDDVSMTSYPTGYCTCSCTRE